jgi:hypothetical protein
MAPSICPTVRHAGGWLFDLSMAGWDVIVLGPSDDPRPLRILGARAVDPKAATAPAPGQSWPEAVAVDAGLYASNERVRAVVKKILDAGTTEVRLWWDDAAPAPERGRRVIQHRLSLAAQAFKAQALAAAHEPVQTVATTESFRSGRLSPVPVGSA